MSTYVYMKVLERAPERYDRGIRRLSGGRIEEIWAEVARRACGPGDRVLDLGCGTGGLALACAERGATVTGIDRDAGMLEVAAAKPLPPGAPPIEWVELGALELEDRFPAATFDAVVSCLLLSELEPEEQAYALRAARRCLKPGGTIVVADETIPAGRGARAWRWLRRFPAAAWTYVLTQTTTRPIRDPGALLAAAGFERVETRPWPGGFSIAQGWRAP